MRPTFKELQDKKWYRLWQVVTWIIVILAFVSPWFIHKPNAWLLVDGMVSSAMWAVIFFVAREVILYILYGKKQITEDDKKKLKEKIKNILNWTVWTVGFFCVLLLIYFIIRESIN